MTRGKAESLTQRIRNAAANEGVPPQRLRNRVAFQRVLARLATGDEWVLKGGFSLEVRLGLRARATKDLDLLRRGPAPASALDLQDALDEALDLDLGDGFEFRVRAPKPMRLEDIEPSTWRVVVEARYAGIEFAAVTIDVVSVAAPSPGEVQPGVESLRIEPVVIGEPFDMAALDLHRHAAEKFHAYARIYAHERPSSRVKDLVDLVLLDESALLDDARLGAALDAVFTERSTALPDQLPDPPGGWGVPFAALADEVGAEAATLEAARILADELYARARAHRAGAQEGTTP